MKIWEEDTCVVFENYRSDYHPSKLGHKSYLQLSEVAGKCTATFGRSLAGGIVHLDADTSCQSNVFSLVHELGHILGFYHEHSRSDRDKYVVIETDKIQVNKKANFEIKYDTNYDDSPYDYSSIMQYGSNVFAKDGTSTTIRTKDPGFQGSIGQRNHLSYYDVLLINKMYNCREKRFRRSARVARQSTQCSTELQCLNEGYVGPHCKCVCPPGLQGKLCDEVPPSNQACGGVLRANEGTFSSPGFPFSYPANTDCHWLIQGDEGSVIKLSIDKIDIEPDSRLCAFDRLEIREEGPQLAGKRYCGSGKTPTIDYRGSGLYVRFATDDSEQYTGFNATYKIVSTSPAGTWGEWTAWSLCPVTCGESITMRSRKCLSKPCDGLDMDVQMCLKQKC